MNLELRTYRHLAECDGAIDCSTCARLRDELHRRSNALSVVTLTVFEAILLGGSSTLYISLNPPQSYWVIQLVGFAVIYAFAFTAGAIAFSKAPR